MASGYQSIHPIMAKNLLNIGIKSNKVTQGYGYATASAGYHEPEGWVLDSLGRHRYSSCVDLSKSVGFTPEVKSRLVAAGFCPFFRDWKNNEHIHCVYVGLPTIKDGPKSQIVDYINGKNGLSGHASLTGPLAPTLEERKIIKEAFDSSDGHNSVSVIYKNKEIPCYAFMGKIKNYDKEVTRCELRSFVEYFGASVIDGTYISYNGKLINFTDCEPKLEGQFTRVNLRSVAKLLSLDIIKFEITNSSYGTAILA